MWKYLFVLGTLIGHSLSYDFAKLYCEPGDEDIYSYNSTLLDGSGVLSFESYRGKVWEFCNNLIWNKRTELKIAIEWTILKYISKKQDFIQSIEWILK